MSSKGQVVIPKDIRVALALQPGEKLSVSRIGRQIVLEAAGEPREQISYEEFRKRVPVYGGTSVSVDDMTVDFSKLGRRGGG